MGMARLALRGAVSSARSAHRLILIDTWSFDPGIYSSFLGFIEETNENAGTSTPNLSLAVPRATLIIYNGTDEASASYKT